MKLSLEALKERAEAIASEELLGSINGGLLDSCHTGILEVDIKDLPTSPSYPGTKGPWR